MATTPYRNKNSSGASIIRSCLVTRKVQFVGYFGKALGCSIQSSLDSTILHLVKFLGVLKSLNENRRKFMGALFKFLLNAWWLKADRSGL